MVPFPPPPECPGGGAGSGPDPGVYLHFLFLIGMQLGPAPPRALESLSLSMIGVRWYFDRFEGPCFSQGLIPRVPAETGPNL